MSAKYDQIIYETALNEGFNPEAAKLIVAQARFESADYTSNVFKKNLNTSGMKFIGQKLATRGSIAPLSERSNRCKSDNVCVNSDYYASFKSVADSAKDKIQRNYNITMRGVTPQQLKSVKNADEFATLLKKRGYYGDSEANYSRGLKSKLLRIQVVEFVSKNRNTLYLGGGILLISLAYYLYSKRKN
jgi:hypothetical protein